MKYEDIVKKWQEQPINDAADIDLKLRNFRIVFAYHSVRLESTGIDYNNTKEIFESGRVSGYSGDIKTLFGLQNHKDCYERLKKPVLKKEPISLELIKLIHYELCKSIYDESRITKGERPGEFKKYNYVSGYYDAGSDAAAVEEDLNELVSEVNEYTGDKVIKVAAYLHARFGNIYPFADGNGRTGRMIMNYYLMVHDHPPLVIFEEDRKKYSKALEAFDSKEELEPLVEFLTNQFEKTWK